MEKVKTENGEKDEKTEQKSEKGTRIAINQNTESDKTKEENEYKAREQKVKVTHKLRNAHRIVISKAAKAALDELLKKANDGFDAGEITKSDIVNSLLVNSSKYFTDAEIKSMRAQHFDESKVLAALLKGVSQGEPLPENLKTLLRGQYGLAENPKKKSSSPTSCS